MKLWLYCCVLCISATAAAQNGATIPTPTKIAHIQSSGTTKLTETAPIELGSDWKTQGLLDSIRGLNLVTSATQLTVGERQVNHGSVRVVLQAHYQNMPILDRDIVVIVDAQGRIDRVNANLARFDAAHTPTLDETQSMTILNEHLLRHYGPSNLTPSPLRKTGWLQFGSQLWPVVEFEVLDPIGFRHFTARVDQVNARVISVTERTKD